MRLVCDENIVGLEALADRCELVTAAGRAIGAQLLRDADALWVRSVTRVDATLLAGSSLRFVGTATAGVEHIDRAALAQRHIPFAAAPGANANAVVEYVLAALAELAEPWRRLDQGGSLGIVGYGHVGRLLARVATGLGWRVRVSDPWVEAGGEAVPGTAALADILDCDVISLHCSLHDRAPWPSRHLIDGPALARLRGEQCRSGKPGSNWRPQPWQGCALPTELFPLSVSPGRGRGPAWGQIPNSCASTSRFRKRKWRPLGGSNPCSRRERAVS
jgi:erythronate-4-phosphate dehydrogenase